MDFHFTGPSTETKNKVLKYSQKNIPISLIIDPLYFKHQTLFKKEVLELVLKKNLTSLLVTVLDTEEICDYISHPNIERLILYFKNSNDQLLNLIPESMKKIQNLKTLSINFLQKDQNKFIFLNEFKNLVNLTLNSMIIDNSLNKSISNIKLKKILINRSKFDENFNIETDLTQLETLSLKKCSSINLKSFYNCIKGNQCLKLLTIEDNLNQKSGIEYLYEILNEIKLETLYLQNFEGFDSFKNNDYAFHIKTINVGKINITKLENFINFLSVNKALNLLNLSEVPNIISENTVSFCETLQNLKLENLHLFKCKMNQKELGNYIKNEKNLKRLKINDDFENGFPGLEENQSLKELYFKSNLFLHKMIKIGDNIENLMISHLKTSDKEFEIFLKNLKEKKNLNSLNLEHPDVNLSIIEEYLSDNLYLIDFKLFTHSSLLKPIFKGLVKNKKIEKVNLHSNNESDQEDIKDLIQYNHSIIQLQINHTIQHRIEFLKRNIEIKRIREMNIFDTKKYILFKFK